MTNIKRLEGETVCGSCSKPAAFQISSTRWATNDHSSFITGAMVLCDDCAGSMRYKLMIRHWDMAGDCRYRPHGWGPRWHKTWDGIEPEPVKKAS